MGGNKQVITGWDWERTKSRRLKPAEGLCASGLSSSGLQIDTHLCRAGICCDRQVLSTAKWGFVGWAGHPFPRMDGLCLCVSLSKWVAEIIIEREMTSIWLWWGLV